MKNKYDKASQVKKKIKEILKKNKMNVRNFDRVSIHPW